MGLRVLLVICVVGIVQSKCGREEWVCLVRLFQSNDKFCWWDSRRLRATGEKVPTPFLFVFCMQTVPWSSQTSQFLWVDTKMEQKSVRNGRTQSSQKTRNQTLLQVIWGYNVQIWLVGCDLLYFIIFLFPAHTKWTQIVVKKVTPKMQTVFVLK
jgi:hypothetical protein